ncbi:MAG: response regulator transcription factor, partial [Bacteroidales bacterium]|nr:response regulator transcription factor [Bacteroidales bacterium]
MTSLRCFVVDDEPLAVKMLENFIERTPFLELAGSFTDPVLALSEIRTQAPQLVFLDIQMPDLSGMELSRMIPDGTRIIFTTAFKQYAFESYEVSALDFLLKPIRYQKFLEAAEKAREWFTLKEAAAATPVSAPEAKSSTFFKVDGALRKVEYDDILFVEGMKDYVMVYLASQRQPLVTHVTMKAMEEMLPAGFMRIHRSFIVAL